MGRTPIDTVRDNLRQAYDPAWASHVYGLMQHTLGGKYTPNYAGGFSPGELPDFPDIMPQFYKVGESRQMLDNSKLMMMKVCKMAPEVSFPDLDPLTEAVNKAWIDYIWNYDDYDECSSSARETHRTFMDGDNFGLGYTSIETINNRTHIMHAPMLSVIQDRHVLNAGRSRFFARVHNLPVETAVDIWGSSVKSDATSLMEWNGITPSLERVKVIEWVDRGFRKWDPTKYYILNNFGGRVLGVEDNDDGCLPTSHYEMFHFSQTRRPMGRIDTQFPVQEAKNALERLIKLSLKRGSAVDLILSQHIHPDDLALLNQGAVLPMVRVIGDADPNRVLTRIPATDIPNMVYNYMEMLDRQLNTGSGNSDGDRANMSLEDRTLGQEQMKQAGADIQTAWSRMQYADYLRRLIVKLRLVGASNHLAPTLLVIEGQPILFNDPENPNSLLSKWLSKPSTVNVSDTDSSYQDPDMKAMQRQSLWKQFIGDPFTNQMELRKYLFAQMGNRNDEMIDPTGQYGQGVPAQQTGQGSMSPMMPQLAQMGMV